MIAGAVALPPTTTELLASVAMLESEGASRSAAVREIASRHGVSRRELYDAALRAPDDA